ncbi:hypothetical protein PG989_011741 [Apiospora arundinis]
MYPAPTKYHSFLTPVASQQSSSLGSPRIITLAERYEIMGWIPPKQLHKMISDTTGCQISIPKELLDKAHQMHSLKSLTLDELELLETTFKPVSAL